MAFALGASAVVTDRYLSMNIEFGDENAFTPELVKSIVVTIKTKEGLELRTLDTLSDFANSDGCFKLGTILYEEEKPSKVFVAAVTTKGKFKTECDVSTAPNTVTASQF